MTTPISAAVPALSAAASTAVHYVAAGVSRPAWHRTLSSIQQEAKQLATQFSDRVRVQTIGRGAEPLPGGGFRPIQAIQVSLPGAPAGGRPRLALTAGVHAREVANPNVLMDQVQRIVADSYLDTPIRRLLEQVDLDIIPVVNVDGYAAVEQQMAAHVPGKELVRTNSRGVDLNRNFKAAWGEDARAARSVGDVKRGLPGSNDYPGPHGESEPETQAVADYIRMRRPTMVIDWHSASEVVVTPYMSRLEPLEDAGAMQAIAGWLATTMGPRYAPAGTEMFGNVSGSLAEWARREVGAAAVTIETVRVPPRVSVRDMNDGYTPFIPRDSEYREVLSGAGRTIEGALGLVALKTPR